MLYIENQRREELVVFIQQRILIFSCLLEALPPVFWHGSHRLHFKWHALSRSTQLPRWHWKLLSGIQWASMQAATAQLSWAVWYHMAQWQLCLLKALMEQPQIPWDLMLVLFMQLWHRPYKTSTEGWKVTHQANWKCNIQHLLRVDTMLTFLCYKHKVNKKL